MKAYTRWYHWLIYLTLAGLFLTGTAIGIEEVRFRCQLKQDFVASCLAEFSPQISGRQCRCVYRELRREYSVVEMWGRPWSWTEFGAAWIYQCQ